MNKSPDDPALSLARNLLAFDQELSQLLELVATGDSGAALSELAALRERYLWQIIELPVEVAARLLDIPNQALADFDCIPLGLVASISQLAATDETDSQRERVAHALQTILTERDQLKSLAEPQNRPE